MLAQRRYAAMSRVKHGALFKWNHSLTLNNNHVAHVPYIPKKTLAEVGHSISSLNIQWFSRCALETPMRDEHELFSGTALSEQKG